MYKVVTADGVDSDTIDLATLGQWAVEGRIGRDSLVRDVQTGQQFKAAEHPFLSNRLPKLHESPPPFRNSDTTTRGSALREQEDVPAEMPKWNWGAFGMGVFGLGWLWAVNHKITSVFTVLFPFFLLHVCLFIFVMSSRVIYPASSDIVSLLNLGYLGAGIYLGICGNRLAWRSRQFLDIDDFKACQRIWGWWTLGLTILMFLLLAAFLAIGAAIDADRNL